LTRLSKKDVITFENEIAYIEYKEYPEGEKLIAEGQSDQMIYWILAGHAHIVNTIKNQPQIIHEAREGECIGEQTVLRGAIRTADVVAGEGGAVYYALIGRLSKGARNWVRPSPISSPFIAQTN